MDNRSQFKKILLENNITQAESARLISEWTKRPCSIRSIRSWLNNPTKPSSRSCPDWALNALKNIVEKKSK